MTFRLFSRVDRTNLVFDLLLQRSIVHLGLLFLLFFLFLILFLLILILTKADRAT